VPKPRDRSRNTNNNIPMKIYEDSRVASCIQSPDMLDDDGLNGEIKYPPEILQDRSRIGIRQTANEKRYMIV